MLSCDTPCAPGAECYCRRVNAARSGQPTAYTERRRFTPAEQAAATAALPPWPSGSEPHRVSAPRACAGCPNVHACNYGAHCRQPAPPFGTRAHADRKGILSLTPGTPAHAAAVAARGRTDAERDGL